MFIYFIAQTKPVLRIDAKSKYLTCRILGDIYISIYLFKYIYIYLSIYLSIYLKIGATRPGPEDHRQQVVYAVGLGR